MLIETLEGVINASHIISAEPISGTPGGSKCRVTLIDGSKVVASVGMGDLERACGVVVPAQPGFTLVRSLLPFGDDDAVLYVEEAVLAFRVNSGAVYRGAIPITAAGEPLIDTDDYGSWVIVQPSGRCCGPDGEHDSLDEFKADYERRLAKERTAKPVQEPGQ